MLLNIRKCLTKGRITTYNMNKYLQLCYYKTSTTLYDSSKKQRAIGLKKQSSCSIDALGKTEYLFIVFNTSPKRFS